jgi:hypothetical protein
MRMSLFHYLPVAVFLALKPLNILGLELPSSLVSVRRLSASDGGPSMTKLTSMSGLITISPEGGS